MSASPERYSLPRAYCAASKSCSAARSSSFCALTVSGISSPPSRYAVPMMYWGVGVTVLRKLLQLLRRFIPFLQRETVIIRYALQIQTRIAHVIGADPLTVILHLLVLKGKFVHADMFCFFDDGVLDLAELLLLGQRRTQTFLFLHRLSRFHYQFVSRFAFLLVDVQQLLTEDLIGERGLDLADTVFGQVCLIRLCRPRHHVDVGMIPFVMERRVPAEVLRRYH